MQRARSVIIPLHLKVHIIQIPPLTSITPQMPKKVRQTERPSLPALPILSSPLPLSPLPSLTPNPLRIALPQCSLFLVVPPHQLQSRSKSRASSRQWVLSLRQYLLPPLAMAGAGSSAPITLTISSDPPLGMQSTMRLSAGDGGNIS